MTFTPSPAQQAFYDWVDNDQGHCILEAVAGAGKTTTILNGIERMKGRVWFGVYNKKMADEIKEKVDDNPKLKCRPFPHEALFTKTFHSEGMGMVRYHNGRNTTTEVDDKKVSKIIESMIAEAEGRAQERREDLREIAGTVESIVGMAKNRGFVSARILRFNPGLSDFEDVKAWWDMIEHFDLDGGLAEGYDQQTVLNFSRAVLQRNNKNTRTIDFNDMVYLPLALDLRAFGHDWVLIDEAQDTNPTRRALAKKLLKKSGRLVAVGDPHQAIFGFTGADNDSLEQIERAFHAHKLPLTVTYRCPKAIVKHAQQWVSHITAHESAPEGEVRTLPYQNLIGELECLPRAEYSENAVLCRYNKYLVGLCFKMIRAGMPAKIEGRDIGNGLIKLATRWKTCKTVNGLETKLREYMDREVAKAMKKQQEDKADRITDTVETIIVMIERCREKNLDRVTDLTEMIEDMFQDNVSDSGLITLCSTHKSKGLEWEYVYLLDREAFMPSKMARQEWQVAQENNLIYVAVTRAKKTLIEVTGVVEEKDPTAKEAA